MKAGWGWYTEHGECSHFIPENNADAKTLCGLDAEFYQKKRDGPKCSRCTEFMSLFHKRDINDPVRREMKEQMRNPDLFEDRYQALRQRQQGCGVNA